METNGFYWNMDLIINMLVVGREKRSGKEDANYCRVLGLAPLFEPSTILLPSVFFQDGSRGESRASL